VRGRQALGAAGRAKELNEALRLLLKHKEPPLLAFALADALAVATTGATDSDEYEGGGKIFDHHNNDDDYSGDGGEEESFLGGFGGGAALSSRALPLVPPNLATFHLAMSSAISAREPQLALGVLQDMRVEAAARGKNKGGSGGGGRGRGGGKSLEPNEVTHRLAKRALKLLQTTKSEEGGPGPSGFMK